MRSCVGAAPHAAPLHSRKYRWLHAPATKSPRKISSTPGGGAARDRGELDAESSVARDRANRGKHRLDDRQGRLIRRSDYPPQERAESRRESRPNQPHIVNRFARASRTTCVNCSSVPRAGATPAPGPPPGLPKAPKRGVAPARSADCPRRASGRRTPLALRRISLSRRTPGRQLASVDLSTEMSTSRTPGRTVCPDERSTGCSTW
jgi:hypothetical protein